MVKWLKHSKYNFIIYFLFYISHFVPGLIPLKDHDRGARPIPPPHSSIPVLRFTRQCDEIRKLLSNNKPTLHWRQWHI